MKNREWIIKAKFSQKKFLLNKKILFSNKMCSRVGFSKRLLFRKVKDEALKLEDEAPCFLRMRLPDFLRSAEDEAPSFLRMRLPDFLRLAEDEAPCYLRMRLPPI